MALNLTFKKGDTGDDLSGTLKDEDGAIDLSGATVKFYMENTDDDSMKIDGRTITVTDAANGKVKVDWNSGDLDTVGVYRAEFVASYSDGEVTVPNSDYIYIEVDDEVKNS